jgi:hypothetical protein
MLHEGITSTRVPSDPYIRYQIAAYDYIDVIKSLSAERSFSQQQHCCSSMNMHIA